MSGGGGGVPTIPIQSCVTLALFVQSGKEFTDVLNQVWDFKTYDLPIICPHNAISMCPLTDYSYMWAIFSKHGADNESSGYGFKCSFRFGILGTADENPDFI